MVSGGLGGLAGLPADAREIETTGHYGLTLVILDYLNPLVLRFPINPESDSHDSPQGWSDRGALGQVNPKLDWTHNPAGSLSFKALVQAPDSVRLEADFLRPLELLRERIVPSTQEPPLVIATFGTRQYRGCISSLNVTRLRQTAQGDAVTAEVSITIMENSK